LMQPPQYSLRGPATKGKSITHAAATLSRKTKLSGEASIKVKWMMWKRSFPARRPSKTQSGRCENEAFVRDFPQNLKAEDVKTKLSCQTSCKFGKFKLRQTTPELSVPRRGRSDHDPSIAETVPKPSRDYRPSPSIIQGTFCPAKNNISCIC
jgi:hypothetical protein